MEMTYVTLTKTRKATDTACTAIRIVPTQIG